ncbi:MAG: short-chain dehydrogenase/reductase [Acidimicrobiales bacterium]|nr:short-chain dehydrogenase/reductase [Acidimicrobiales bacterium]
MRVLITGAARAIGAATAQVLTERGFEVVATARRPELLADVPAALRLPLDVTDDESVRACMAEAGPIDVLVNNAAISEPGPLERYPIDRFRAVLETNVVGALRLVQAVVPGMRERGSGVVVNVSSVNGRVASPLGGAYAASKFALEAVGETLHFELGHFGIRVVLVEPGFVAPGMKGGPEWGMEPPYDELGRQWSGTDDSLLGDQGRPGPEVVGEAIHRAITTDEPVLRWPVGADAELVLATRAALDDAAFEAAMRETLGLSW